MMECKGRGLSDQRRLKNNRKWVICIVSFLVEVQSVQPVRSGFDIPRMPGAATAAVEASRTGILHGHTLQMVERTLENVQAFTWNICKTMDSASRMFVETKEVDDQRTT